MREFTSGNVNLNSGRTFNITLDQGETDYYAEIDVTNHKASNQLMTQEVYWVIGGQEVFHRRLTRTGQETLDRNGQVDTKCRFSGQIHPDATAARVYVETSRPVQSSVLIRLT